VGEQVKEIQATLTKAQQQKNRLDEEWLKSVDRRINALTKDSLPVAPAKPEDRR
jgi:hypothetical protein